MTYNNCVLPDKKMNNFSNGERLFSRSVKRSFFNTKILNRMISFFQKFQNRMLQATCLTLVLTLTSFTANFAQPSTCAADAGTLNAIDVCFLSNQVILKATPAGNAEVPADFEVLYVLTSGSGLVIEQVSAEPIFSLPTSPAGLFTLHTLVYNPNTLDLSIVVPGTTTGFDVNSLLVQGGGNICASLDVQGVKVRFGTCDDDGACIANAGTLTPVAGACLLNGVANLKAEVATASVVPNGYNVLYVLTRTDDLIIEQVNAEPMFAVNSADKYRIHTLVFDPNTLDLTIVVPGTTTGVDVNGLLIQGGGDICAALDVAGAVFEVAACPAVCEARAGRVVRDNEPCLENGRATLRARVANPANIPAGYQRLYVLTSGNDLIIERVSAQPMFEVTRPGIFTIHTLVFDPNTLDLSIVQFGVTTGFDVNSLLIQGGGAICASLDVQGARFNISPCIPVCAANAGKLRAEGNPCLENGRANLHASHSVTPFVPQGFQRIYVLTSGDNLVIEQTSNQPAFQVRRTGVFTIHTLVYDPNTLDLSIIVPGVTTGFTVNSLLIQGGGRICASLDVTGARFNVNNCPPVCTAKAGRLRTDNNPCLQGSSTMLRARFTTHPTVPQGFQVLYVLTSGTNLVIEQVNTQPMFTVNRTGIFTIHTLVYNPNTLDLSIVVPGVTTGFNVNSLLIQGGGSICAVLDVAGARFNINACPPACSANAGTLTAENAPCLQNGVATLKARNVMAPVVPQGFQVLYVLTSGSNLVIEQVSARPSFTVRRTGLFTIHTLVYNPNTLNLGIVRPGVTTGFDVNALLLQGGGSICAALDVAGAKFNVGNCNALTRGLNAYPNPASDLVNVQFDNPGDASRITVQLLDQSGNLLKTWELDGQTEQTTLNISALSTGAYNLIVRYDNRMGQTLRIVKAN